MGQQPPPLKPPSPFFPGPGGGPMLDPWPRKLRRRRTRPPRSGTKPTRVNGGSVNSSVLTPSDGPPAPRGY